MNQTLPTLKVALLGCGVVGTDVARLLTEQPHHLRADRTSAEHGDLQSLVALHY